MKLLELPVQRSAAVTIVILTLGIMALGACSRDYVFEGNEYSNPIRNARIKELYQARDACLARNAAAESTGTDVASIARAVSLSCMPEIDKLIAASNLDKDPKVAEAIRSDSDRKATVYVLRAQR
jgi:hypothetical protein